MASTPRAAKPRAAKPKAARPAASRAAPARRPDASGPRRGLFSRGPRVNSKILSQFTMQLATLQNAGLPLVRSLRILEGQLRPGPFPEVVAAVAEDVEGGAPLSEALAKYPEIFDRLYVNMVRAGEAGGVLGKILDRLAEFGRKSEHIKAQIKSAMTYPALVLGIALVIVVFVMTVIVPKLGSIFSDLGEELPAATIALLAFSDALITYWYVFLALPILLYLGFRGALRHEAIAYRVDQLKLSIPIFGTLLRQTIVARFARTLGTLLQSGVPILESLAIVRAAIPNRVLEDAVGEVHASIREGETIALPLGESGVFDDIVVNMIDVGEATGKLDEMLLRVADIFEQEVDLGVTTLFKVIEPVILLVMAVLVGFIVVSLFLPIVKIMDALAGA